MAKMKAAEKGKGAKGKNKAKSADEQPTYDDLIERFRKPAQKLRDEKVLPCRADVRVAYANIQQGLTAVFGAAGDPARKQNVAAIKKALPELSTKKVLDVNYSCRLATTRIV